MDQSLGLSLDPAAGAALYQQIFDQLADRIRSGAFPVGFRLPPSRALASALHTNRNTVVRAYEDLLAAGFLESTVGRGTFVARVVGAATRPVPGRPATLDSAVGAGLPWATLVARPVLAEPLSRLEWLQRSIRAMSTDAINLAHMEPGPDLLPDELIRRCTEHVLRTAKGKALRYSPREGQARLRGLIALDLARQGVPAATEQIVVTSGSQQGIDLLARTLLNPGEPFLLDDSTFAGALSAFAATGARLCGVPSDEEGPSLAALERLGAVGAKGFYLMPNSHNPTGASISQARREALVAWSHRFGVPLIEDDYVADLDLDGTPRPVPMRALDGDVIHVGSFSKRLSPALRVGFLIVPAALRPRLIQLKNVIDTGGSELLQQVLAEFLERGYLQAHLGKTLPIYRRRRNALETALTRHLPRSLTWQRPARGLSLWLPLPAELPVQEVFEQAQRKGVLVHPSSLNTVEDRGRGGGIRLTFCTEPETRLIEGARRLGRAIAEVGGRERPDEAAASAGGI